MTGIDWCRSETLKLASSCDDETVRIWTVDPKRRAAKTSSSWSAAILPVSHHPNHQSRGGIATTPEREQECLDEEINGACSEPLPVNKFGPGWASIGESARWRRTIATTARRPQPPSVGCGPNENSNVFANCSIPMDGGSGSKVRSSRGRDEEDEGRDGRIREQVTPRPVRFAEREPLVPMSASSSTPTRRTPLARNGSLSAMTENNGIALPSTAPGIRTSMFGSRFGEEVIEESAFENGEQSPALTLSQSLPSLRRPSATASGVVFNADESPQRGIGATTLGAAAAVSASRDGAVGTAVVRLNLNGLDVSPNGGDLSGEKDEGLSVSEAADEASGSDPGPFSSFSIAALRKPCHHPAAMVDGEGENADPHSATTATATLAATATQDTYGAALVSNPRAKSTVASASAISGTTAVPSSPRPNVSSPSRGIIVGRESRTPATPVGQTSGDPKSARPARPRAKRSGELAGLMSESRVRGGSARGGSAGGGSTGSSKGSSRQNTLLAFWKRGQGEG